MEKENWYQAKTSNGQGLIVEEKTGRNVAVTYDEKDAPRIVEAVNNFDAMLELIKGIPFNCMADSMVKDAKEILRKLGV